MNYNPFTLQNKKILITGASSGIGKTTAIECAKMGAKVIITGRNLERLKETYELLEGDGHILIPADLCNKEEIQALIDKLPVLDGCVNNAGIGVTKPFLFTNDDLIKDIFDLNFNSQINLIRFIIKKKKINKNSSIVIVSSISGVTDFPIGNSIYAASKGALHAMMKTMALELSNKKIRVNSVNPGMIETNLINNLATITEEQLAEDRKKYPMKRYGTPEDVSYGIIYLLSNASAWVTGTSLVIDGGITIS